MYKTKEEAIVFELEKSVERLEIQLENEKKETNRLKKELARLRKNQHLEVILEQEQELKEILKEKREQQEQVAKERSLRERWQCKECGRGVLVVKTLETPNSKIYSRACDNCHYKTKWKVYSDGIKGVFDKVVS